VNERICIFCMKHESDTTPWCPDNPGEGCTYGCGHEYPPGEAEKPKQPPKKPDKNRCVKCDLHRKNPAAATNGCTHEFPT